MTRRRRTEILAKAEPAFAARLADMVRRAYEVRIIQEPQQALVMVKYRESSRCSLFYLGEVLVTEAKVSIGNYLGLGIAQRDDGEVAAAMALDTAVIDAAYAAGLRESILWEELLEEAERHTNEEAALDQRRILRSKVAFETMDSTNGD